MMGGFGPPFTQWGMGGGTQCAPYTPVWGMNTYSLEPRAQYLALRNAADGRKAHCAYCRRRATWDDGKNCPGCGATDVVLK